MASLVELANQIYKVEGVQVDLVHFMDRKSINRLDEFEFPDYPYSEPIKGDVTDLITKRIIPILDQRVKEDE